MISITQIPFEIEASDTNETEVKFSRLAAAPGNKVFGWIVSKGKFQVSVGKPISSNTPQYAEGANDKDWARITPDLDTIYIKAGTAGDKISFTI